QTQQLYFCAPNATAAPFALTTPQIQYDSMRWSGNRQDYRNRQILQIQAAAFAQSNELFACNGSVTQFTLTRPPAQVPNAWLTQNTKGTQNGTFTAPPSPGDTATISFPSSGSIFNWAANSPYTVGQIIIDPAGHTQVVVVATAPNNHSGS